MAGIGNPDALIKDILSDRIFRPFVPEGAIKRHRAKKLTLMTFILAFQRQIEGKLQFMMKAIVKKLCCVHKTNDFDFLVHENYIFLARNA